MIMLTLHHSPSQWDSLKIFFFTRGITDAHPPTFIEIVNFRVLLEKWMKPKRNGVRNVKY